MKMAIVLPMLKGGINEQNHDIDYLLYPSLFIIISFIAYILVQLISTKHLTIYV